MREGTRPTECDSSETPGASNSLRRIAPAILVALAAAAGLGLMLDSLSRSSPTYDEALYIRSACRWWRTGDQSRLSWGGVPLTFWKLQQVPVLWGLDRLGYGTWIDDPASHEAELLVLARASALWMWLAAFGLAAYWSRRLYGPRAMVLAAWWFAMSPNLLAHGSLATTEIPIVASMTAMVLLFSIFLERRDPRAFIASAIVGGLAFSCKFTAAVVPPILALLWMIGRWNERDGRPGRLALRVAAGMAAFAAIMAVTDVAITGGAMLPISEQSGNHPSFAGRLGPRAGYWIGQAIETPIPQDWAGFARQTIMQGSGGPSYLFGHVRETGWRYYYLVALAVKVPLVFWLIFGVRTAMARRIPATGRDWILPIAAVAFLAIASLGSTRNLGVRYMLPVAPLAIVWISGLAGSKKWVSRLAWGGLAAQLIAVASIHPYELSYFNVLAGGPVGGRRILSDSNLDWAQGLKPLARLQRERPELRDLTLYYFGDTEPERYGVEGRCYTVRSAHANERVPRSLTARTEYLGVSASLQWGPWAASGFFRPLEGVEPLCYTPDSTIAIYRTADIAGLHIAVHGDAPSPPGPVVQIGSPLHTRPR